MTHKMNLYIRDAVTSIEQLKPYKFYAKDDKMFSHLADKHGWIKVEVWW